MLLSKGDEFRHTHAGHSRAVTSGLLRDFFGSEAVDFCIICMSGFYSGANELAPAASSFSLISA
jgi:hypothetical protein